jgi:maltose alpha-D-glucosyltransferase/alpha-amylase
MSTYLMEQGRFESVARFVGSAAFVSPDGKSRTFATVHSAPPNQGDGWNWSLEELYRYFEQRASAKSASSGEPDTAVQYAEVYLKQAAILGQRTAELHIALAAPTPDPAFAPEPVTSEYLQNFAQSLSGNAQQALDLLRENMPVLSDSVVDVAASVLARRREIMQRCREVSLLEPRGSRIRVHGRYELGQVLLSKSDYIIRNFEGDPLQTAEERRARHLPAKDVASMLYSISSAACTGWLTYALRRPGDTRVVETWARSWANVVADAFLVGYRGLLPDEADSGQLLACWQLSRALEDLREVLSSRREAAEPSLHVLRWLIGQ